jgi:hypothetical protein
MLNQFLDAEAREADHYAAQQTGPWSPIIVEHIFSVEIYCYKVSSKGANGDQSQFQNKPTPFHTSHPPSHNNMRVKAKNASSRGKSLVIKTGWKMKDSAGRATSTARK